MDELRRLTMDDRHLMIEIVTALVDDASRHTGLLETALDERDASRSARIARHASRACANVGANAAAETFRQLGQHAASREFTACQTILPEARAQIDRLRAETSRL